MACHSLGGHLNGHTAIREQFPLLQSHFSLPDRMLFTSDRGTFSAAHAAMLYRHQQHILCAVTWKDSRALYEEHAPTLLR